MPSQPQPSFYSSLIQSLTQRPRLLDPAVTQQEQLPEYETQPLRDSRAMKALKTRVRDLQDNYDEQLAKLGSAPQRSDYESHPAYASAFNDWADQQHRLQVGFDQARQSELDSYNRPLIRAGRPALIVPPWKPATQPVATAEREPLPRIQFLDDFMEKLRPPRPLGGGQ